MARSRRRKLPPDPVTVDIDAMSHDGRGVAHIDGKTVFIQGALPGEEISFIYTRKQRRHDEGKVHEIFKASPERVVPRCPQFGLCGGCALQHQETGAQIAHKQQALLDAFQRIGKVEPEALLPPLAGDSIWGYRRKARLGVKYVTKKGKVLVGFRERGSGFITDTERCYILDPKVGELITPLAEMIDGLSVRDRLPQIEVAIGDDACVLIFRVLSPLSDDDLSRLQAFSDRWDVVPYLQEGGPETIRPLSGVGTDLSYTLPAHQLKVHFLPTDFTQVNSGLNRSMVDRALQLLNPESGDRLLDLFCGLGNFTLPLARHGKEVVGVEGDAGLVSRARDNARDNQIANVRYYTANLYESLDKEPWMLESFDKALLDPPRSGAQEVLEQLPKLGVKRILYVSCYPGTLARDAGELVNRHGYRLVSAGVMDMFPHTAHVESIALFQKGE